MTAPTAPATTGFRIIGNLYFVGVKGFSSHLLTTPAGHILLDAGMPASAPAILDNIRALGFAPADIRFILISHAHIDHLGGAPLLAAETGACVCLHKADLPAAASGVPGEEGEREFAPVQVGRVLEDADAVALGGATVRTIHTPGHTPGCLTFEFAVPEGGRSHQCMLFGGPGIGHGKDPASWPADRRRITTYLESVRRLHDMNPDIWLGAHPQFNRTFEKQAMLAAGITPNPFIDPAGWKDYIAARIGRAQELLAEIGADGGQ